MRGAKHRAPLISPLHRLRGLVVQSAWCEKFFIYFFQNFNPDEMRNILLIFAISLETLFCSLCPGEMRRREKTTKTESLSDSLLSSQSFQKRLSMLSYQRITINNVCKEIAKISKIFCISPGLKFWKKNKRIIFHTQRLGPLGHEADERESLALRYVSRLAYSSRLHWRPYFRFYFLSFFQSDERENEYQYDDQRRELVRTMWVSSKKASLIWKHLLVSESPSLMTSRECSLFATSMCE